MSQPEHNLVQEEAGANNPTEAAPERTARKSEPNYTSSQKQQSATEEKKEKSLSLPQLVFEEIEYN